MENHHYVKLPEGTLFSDRGKSVLVENCFFPWSRNSYVCESPISGRSYHRYISHYIYRMQSLNITTMISQQHLFLLVKYPIFWIVPIICPFLHIIWSQSHIVTLPEISTTIADLEPRPFHLQVLHCTHFKAGYYTSRFQAIQIWGF